MAKDSTDKRNRIVVTVAVCVGIFLVLGIVLVLIWRFGCHVICCCGCCDRGETSSTISSENPLHGRKVSVMIENKEAREEEAAKSEGSTTYVVGSALQFKDGSGSFTMKDEDVNVSVATPEDFLKGSHAEVVNAPPADSVKADSATTEPCLPEPCVEHPAKGDQLVFVDL